MFDPHLVHSNGNFEASFFGTLGQHYRYEFAPDLLSNAWLVVTDIVEMTESPIFVTVPATNPAGYYRAIREP